MPWDLTVPTEAADPVGREAFAAGGLSALAVEDSGDGGVGVVDGQSPDQFDRALLGADRGDPVAAQIHVEVGQGPALPAQDQTGLRWILLDADVDFLQQRAKEFLAVAVGGGWRIPYALQVRSQGVDLLALFVRQSHGMFEFSPSQFGLGGGQVSQPLLPLGFQCARHQTVLGLDRLVSGLGAVGLGSAMMQMF